MKLRCDDVVSGLGCTYVAHGEDPGEVKEAMMAHGSDVHSNLLEGLPADILAQRKLEMEERIGQLVTGLH